MIKDIYIKSYKELLKKPFKLLGIAWLSVLLCSISVSLFPIPGLSLALQWLIQTSTCLIFLNAYLGKGIECSQLFDSFRSWDTIKRVLLGIGWMTLWILIWSLIPVVGPVLGIIRSYEYRFTPYILINEPEVPFKDAIKISKQRTDGYKGKMFLADIIWIVVAEVVVAILFALSSIRYIGWIFGIANFALMLIVLAVGVVFAGIVRSAFYVEIEKRREGSDYYDPESAKTYFVKNVCKSCGNPLKKDDVFCPKCGTKNAIFDYDVDADADNENVPSPPVSDNSSDDKAEKPEEDNKKTEKKKTSNRKKASKKEPEDIVEE